ncbi:MAG: hypothetical protein K5657_01860 [Desulfovibrio sp.]|nr:hypothetical protein [Desulfovibrio sp.]
MYDRCLLVLKLNYGYPVPDADGAKAGNGNTAFGNFERSGLFRAIFHANFVLASVEDEFGPPKGAPDIQGPGTPKDGPLTWH